MSSRTSPAPCLQMAQALTLFSTRSLSQGPSSEVIYMAEDALKRQYPAHGVISLSATQVRLRRLLRNRYSRRVPAAETIYEGVQAAAPCHIAGSVLVTVLNPDELDVCGWVRATGKTMVHAIDVWEADVPRLERLTSRVDFVLLAYADSVALLKARLGPDASQKIGLFPNYIDDEYFEFGGLAKEYDLIQVGRQDPILHAWGLRYSEERGRSYLYQRRCRQGIYYFDNGEWDSPGVQLSYRRLMTLLARSSIALVSPPDRSDSARTGRVSPLTHRYLEAAMCEAIPLGFAPRGAEYTALFPGTFTGVPGDYDSFARLCDSLLGDSEMRRRWAAANRAYVVQAHSAAARAACLREILSA